MLGETHGYFGKVVQAGFHQTAIRWVSEGKVDASAIDSLVLEIEIRQHPELGRDLRVVETLGPSTVQPFAAASHVAPTLRRDVQRVFAEMHEDPEARDFLQRGLIDRFVPVRDEDYDDIRHMLAECKSAGYMELRYMGAPPRPGSGWRVLF